MDDKTRNSSACGSFNDFNQPMPNPDLSAEEFACFLNAETCNRIVNGTGKEARDVGVYDPKYDAVLIAQRDRAILKAAAERVDRLCESMAVDYNSIEQAKNAILKPITKEKS